MLFPTEFLSHHGRIFPAWGIEESRRYTRALTRKHYENFLVASPLVPKSLRQDYCNVYAFCRWADDLSDESGDSRTSLDLLDWWWTQLREMARGHAFHPVYVALGDTVSRHELPISDFEDLIRAFVRDQTVRRYRTFEALLGYCRFSANPVGRLVLRLHGCQDDTLFALSDSICTALQIANHCQDVARDWRIGRVYVPLDVLQAHGCSLDRLARDVAAGKASPQCREALRDLTRRAASLFRRGIPLAGRCGGRLGFEVEMFARAGMTVLAKIAKRDCDTIASRPDIGKLDLAWLALATAFRRLARPATEAPEAHGMDA